MTVLFQSIRPLDRAENLKAVFNAYKGKKEFVQAWRQTPSHDLHSGYYDLLVTDELPHDSPGKCLFIGHGMGAFKKYGLDQRCPYFHRSDLVTRAIASSVDMVPIVAKQCGIDKTQVVPLGMPRTDAYFKGKPKRESFLYAPTYRDTPFWFPNFNVLNKCMDGKKLLVKFHMMTGDPVVIKWSNIEFIPSTLPSTPYLMDAKALITDYSSILFDAMVLRIPTVLFAKDRYRYEQDRGFYFEYPKRYSERYTEDEQKLAEMVETAEWTDYDEELRTFYTGACDGKSTKRTIELIKEML